MADQVVTEEKVETESAETQATSSNDGKKGSEADRYRAEIAGLNRKITDLNKGLEEIRKAKDEAETAKKEAERSVEERVRDLEEKERQARLELARERRAGQVRDEATKRGLSERQVRLYLSNDWSMDEVISHMDEIVAEETERANAKATAQLGAGYKPGTGAGEKTKPEGTEGMPAEVAEAAKAFEWMQ